MSSKAYYCLGLLLAIASWAGVSLADEPTTTPIAPIKWALVLHGGAGSSPEEFSAEQNQQRREGLRHAIERGAELLKAGGTAMDAVEAVVTILEDDPQFNAGKGAVFNAAGQHELDASIMDGSTGKGGAVAGVTIVKNPILLARRVMTDTRHVLLSGPGADQFARELQLPLVTNDYFDTDEARQDWETTRAKEAQKPGHMGTVGCAALDSHGNLAAGTSTGGLTNKKYGRVGDSPILGAGTFAHNQTCAISCTGIGELFIRNALAYDVSAQMRYQQRSLPEAMRDAIHVKLEKDTGGMIGVDRNGRLHAEFNTAAMAAAMADSNGRLDIIW